MPENQTLEQFFANTGVGESTTQDFYSNGQTPANAAPNSNVIISPEIIGGTLTGASYKSTKSGARIEIFPSYDETAGFVSYAADETTVFKTVVYGANQGDVIIGNYTGNQGILWDQSAGILYVKGNLVVGNITSDNYSAVPTYAGYNLDKTTGIATFLDVKIMGLRAGSNLDGQFISDGTILAAKVNKAIQGWQQTCVFSVTDLDTVAWASGVITFSDGISYNISAGNTGNMSALTYIYLDVNVSTTAYQTTTTAATSVGNGKVLVATAQNGAVEPIYFVFNSPWVNINAGSLVAGSITSTELGAGAIISSKTNISIQDWSTTCLFYKLNQTTVQWSSGNLYLASGTSYAISAGNSGSLTSGQTNYVYFDIAVSTTVFQVTTTISNCIGDGKIFIATLYWFTGDVDPRWFLLNVGLNSHFSGSDLVANSISAAQIKAATITTAEIAANTIVASNIAAGTITVGLLAFTPPQVFTVTPTTPYNVGDLWTDGSFLKKCGTQRLTGAYNAADWVLATSYTDNTVANSKVTTFYQTSIPTSISAGDFWIDSDDSNKLYRATAIGDTTIAAGHWVLIPDNTRIAVAGAAADINANATTIAGGKITANSITASQIAANTITASQIAANTITAGQIAASTITGTQIAANTIVANNISVSQLSAITADMGAITAGTIVLNTSGYIRGGQTDFATGTGWFLGYSGAAYKFSIGSPTNYLKWDGTYLKLLGSFDVGTNGLINNSVYTVATLPVSPTTAGFNPPSAYQAGNIASVATSAISPATTINYTGPGALDWTNPNNSQASDNVYATVIASGQLTKFLKATNFGFSIPTGATINGILVEVQKKATISNAYDSVAKLVNSSDVITGDNKADANYWPATEAYISYGGASDLWGQSWAASDINSANFGFAIAADIGINVNTAYIDHIRITVYYSPPFTNPANAYASDNTYATLAATSGILTVEVSKDAGANWQTPKTVTFTGSDTLQTVGLGVTELFGSSFTRADMVDANFRVRLSHGNYSQVYKTFGFTTGSDLLTGIEVAIEGNYASSTISIDLLKVKIYYGTSVLPVQVGSMAMTSNGRKAGEGAGSGSGVLVYYDGSNWIASDSGATVAA